MEAEHEHGPECQHAIGTREDAIEALDGGGQLYLGAHGFHLSKGQIVHRGIVRDVYAIHDVEHVLLAFAPTLDGAAKLIVLLDQEADAVQVIADLQALREALGGDDDAGEAVGPDRQN